MTPSEILSWVMPCIGFLIVYVLQGIKNEIKDVKTTMAGLERDLRDGITSLDRRVTTIETRCGEHHK